MEDQEINLDKVFRKLLDPKFKFSDWNTEQFFSVGQEAVASESLKQRVLGRLAMEFTNKYGEQNIKKFAQQVHKSAQTIYAYRKVERALFNVDIPEDVNWSTRRAIVESGNQDKYLMLLKEEGYSPAQIVRQIKIDAGTVREKETCPNCQTKITHIQCPKCHAVLRHNGMYTLK